MHFLKNTIAILETEINFFKNKFERKKIICALKDLRVWVKSHKYRSPKSFWIGKASTYA